MYPPTHHTSLDREKLHRVIDTFSLATLVSPAGDDVLVTHLPLMLDRERGRLGLLRGHLDRENPHAAHLDDRPVLAVFHGPNCYISPTVYASDRQLPTWNFVAVHVRGTVRRMPSQDALRRSLILMAERLEGEGGFVLAEDNPKMLQWLHLIVGFEIEIESMEGKLKLSQDKSRADLERARERLVATSAPGTRELLEHLL